MSTRPRRLTVLACALVAVGCGGQDVASPTLEGDVDASVSVIDDEQSPSGSDSTLEEPSPEPSTDDPSDDATDGSPSDGSTSAEAPPDDARSDDAPASEQSGADEAAGGACSVDADEAAIEVARPAPGDTVDATVRLAGCGNTFEATYLWEVELDDGTIAGSGFGTMTCGTGCVGTFDDEVEVSGTGDATLRVFEEDAADGGRTNVVEVPITISP